MIQLKKTKGQRREFNNSIWLILLNVNILSTLIKKERLKKKRKEGQINKTCLHHASKICPLCMKTKMLHIKEFKIYYININQNKPGSMLI